MNVAPQARWAYFVTQKASEDSAADTRMTLVIDFLSLLSDNRTGSTADVLLLEAKQHYAHKKLLSGIMQRQVIRSL